MGYNNDGPGLCPEVSDLSLISRIKDKTTLILPQYAIFGKLFMPDMEDVRIVRSSGSGMGQHDLLAWEIDCGILSLTDKFEDGSLWVNSVFDNWIVRVPPESRRRFVNDLFDALGSNGAETRFEIADGAAEIENVLKNLIESDSATLKTAAKLPLTIAFGEPLENTKVYQTVKRSSVLHGILFLALGASMMYLPEYTFAGFVLAVIAAVVIFQLVMTVRALVKSKWNFRQEKTRVYLFIILAAFFSIVLVNEQALFVVGSALGGICLFILAYKRMIAAKENKDSAFLRVKNIIEAILFAICGGFILVAPLETYRWFALSLGAILILDGIFTFVRSLVIAGRNRKKQ